MEKLTKQGAIELHRKMWNWLADETERTEKIVEEKDFFKTIGILEEDIPDDASYCCEYAKQQSCQNNEEVSSKCKYCPLDWESECGDEMCCNKKVILDINGLLAKLEYMKDLKVRVELLRKIAGLKER